MNMHTREMPNFVPNLFPTAGATLQQKTLIIKERNSIACRFSFCARRETFFLL
jgi:hypothetical protein